MEPQDEFDHAVEFIRTSSSRSASGNDPVTNETKLKLYAYFKIATVQLEQTINTNDNTSVLENLGPKLPKPPFYDFSGSSKWTSWLMAYQELMPKANNYNPDQDYTTQLRLAIQIQSEARKAYIDTVRSHFPEWNPSSEGNNNSHTGFKDDKSPAATGVPAKSNRPKGMVSVSTMSFPSVPDEDQGIDVSRNDDESRSTSPPPSKLHELALEGSGPELEAYLKNTSASSVEQLNLNELDKYGYSALHLAADRGFFDVAEVLLRHGADRTILDTDKNTPLQVAEAAEHGDDLLNLLRSPLAPKIV